MKHFPAGIFVTALFAAMLIFPQAVFSGAEEGLLLWFQIIFPTLFPFLVVTSLLLSSGGLNLITRLFGGLFRRIFRVTQNGAFAVLAGFLCGYPMGAKVTADLLRAEKISDREARYLLSFCNNTSPAFIINFVVWKTIGQEELLAPSLIILFGVPVFLSFFFRRLYLNGQRSFRTPAGSRDTPGRTLDFSVFDSCMMDSFGSIVKVGGYIIAFSILLSLCRGLGNLPAVDLLLPSLEITNGVVMLRENIRDLRICYPLIMGLTSFGGFCSVAQADCMLRGTGIHILPYLAQKLAAAAAASFLAYFYITLFQIVPS